MVRAIIRFGSCGRRGCGWGALRVQPRGSRAIRPSPALPVQDTSRLPICDELSKYVGPTRPWDNNHGRGTQSAQLGHGQRTTCTSGAAAERPARFAAVRAPGALLCSAPARVLCGAALPGTAPPYPPLRGASCCEPCVVRIPPRTNERKGRRFNGSTAAGGAPTDGGRCSRLTL